MKLFILSLSFLFTTQSFAAVKTYQVTGPLLEVTDDTVVIQKGKERWEIAKDTNTKALGGYKKGDKATISYYMTAKQIEPRSDIKNK